MKIVTAVLSAFLFLGAPAASFAATFLQFSSQPGDYVGAGQDLTVPDTGGTFDATRGFDGEVQVLIQQTGSWNWFGRFGPAPGQPLAVGAYENAQDNAPGLPVLSFGGAGRGCTSWGRFTVLEVAYGAGNAVTSLAIDFEQHCDAQEPALYGAIRVNSAIPYVPQVPAPLGPAYLQLDGEPDEFVVGDRHRVIGVDDTIFRVYRNQGGIVLGIEARPGGPPTSWIVNVMPPVGQALALGIQENAQVFPWQEAGHAGFLVAGEGRGGCTSTLPGSGARFNVLELAYGPIESVARLAVDFELRCDGSAGTLHGAVRFHSTIPYVPPSSAPAPQQHASGSSPSGNGTIYATLLSTQALCTFAQSQFFANAGQVPAAPAHYVFPFGLMSVRADNCGAGQAVDFVIEYPKPLPPLATFWKFGPTHDNRTPHWYSMAAKVEGSQVTLHIVDGGDGDDDLAENGSIAMTGGVMAAGGLYQDMWWSGPAENGWGMSVVHHGDTLFSVIYAYDTAGNPTWYVMPGGSWNNDMSAYSGPIYTPHGTPFFAYDASRLAVGAAVGTLTIAFTGSNSGTLQYVINGVAGTKAIQRQAFGVPRGVNEGTLGDMWWGGLAQNGWGIAMLHQYSTMFLVWFTYDASGVARWYVMPGGAWTSSDMYEGHVYRTTGSPWAGAPYDPAKLKVFDVGTYRARFAGDAVTFEYTIDGHAGTLPLVRQPF